ncbi:MAG: tRNA (adenosine(37)-N6)-dimethylallyltransferase MiaA, partial [Candidatus Omnitrophota bacterium]|nr:tRNA (adenosine(37)-N6)-dimethylallyltransferase MiaA [Candidatus Omnitrophota bacterium]
MPKQIVLIVGPTAVGKSSLALALAKKVNGEIVSCDSMQIYKEIRIASNKPTDAQQRDVRHHLLDIVSIEDEFNVAQYAALAHEVIADIHQRGGIPIVVGGSGFYVSVLLDGLFDGVGKQPLVRDALHRFMDEAGQQALYDLLKSRDPAAAAKIHANDVKRMIRALEVIEAQQQPISELQKNRTGGIWGKHDITLYALNRPRSDLYTRINQRVDEMFAAGIVDEIVRLKNAPWSPTAKALIGVKEILGLLEGEYAEPHARELMKLNTRHLAKRQLTWFRKDKRLTWIMLDNTKPPESVVDQWTASLMRI